MMSKVYPIVRAASIFSLLLVLLLATNACSQHKIEIPKNAQAIIVLTDDVNQDGVIVLDEQGKRIGRCFACPENIEPAECKKLALKESYVPMRIDGEQTQGKICTSLVLATRIRDDLPIVLTQERGSHVLRIDVGGYTFEKKLPHP